MTRKNTLVVGASRGLGRGVALALEEAGHPVTAMARSESALASLKEQRPRIECVRGDATDPATVSRVLAAVEADVIVLVAGATPRMRPLTQYDWDSYQAPFQTDTKMTFHWLRDCLTTPKPGRHIIVFSSGAALHGSRLSGGYAPAKQAQRFLCEYARAEAGEELRIQCLLPQLNPNTELGLTGVRAYAKAAGETPEEFVEKRFGTPLSPAIAGREVARLVAEEHADHFEFMLSGKGLAPLSA